MKETRLGPRQWALVVVAGGAVLALPFTQRQSKSKPEPPVVDVTATLLPEATLAGVSVVASTPGHGATASSLAMASPSRVDDLATEPTVPAWPSLPHSPFDELVQQKAVVVDAKPAEDIVPMQPLRPWISAPGLTGSSLPSTSSQVATSASVPAVQTIGSSIGSSQRAVAMASPWREDETDSQEANQQVAASYGHGRRQLPVTAGPADQYTYEELAKKLNLPPQQLAQQAAAKQDLVSAIVPAEQVLPIPPLANDHPGTHLGTRPGSYPMALAGQSSLRSIPKSSVVLSRQPGLKPTGAQIRFGQTESQLPSAAARPNLDSPMVPLPSLPAERRGHMIFQP